MPGFESLGRLLDAAESAAPVDAVAAVTGEAGRRLGASAVSFLIADTSGRALVRLVHVPLDADEVPFDRTDGEERASTLPFDGGPMERVVRTQRLEVVPPADGPGRGHWTVLAPVTERGEAIGLLELLLPVEPDAAETAEMAALAHLLAFVVLANRQHTDLFEWGHRTPPPVRDLRRQRLRDRRRAAAPG